MFRKSFGQYYPSRLMVQTLVIFIWEPGVLKGKGRPAKGAIDEDITGNFVSDSVFFF